MAACKVSLTQRCGELRSSAATAFFNPIASPITAATNETLAQNDIFPCVVPTPPSFLSRDDSQHQAASASLLLSEAEQKKKQEKKTKEKDCGGVVQAAGHGLLRLDPDRDGAIVKPTTRQECVTYECMKHDPTMARFVARFIPHYFASWPMRHVVPGSKFTHEVSLANLCRLADDGVLHWRGEIEMMKSAKASRLSWRVNPVLPPASDKEDDNDDDDAAVTTTVVYQSPPSVLDLKIGRYRHTKTTPLRKFMRQMRKDAPTSARSVGMRICGVKHCRGVLDSFLTAEEIAASRFGNDNNDEEGKEQCRRADFEEKRRLRRAAMTKKRNEKAMKHDESDSEIMQLPKAMEQAEKTTKQKKEGDDAVSPSATATSQSSHVPDILQWSEDKIFGRNCNPDELLEALAMFCTLLVDVDDAVGRLPLCREDKSAPLRFDPAPQRALLEFFRGRVVELIDVLEKDYILSRYSFASASILFLHRWRVMRVKTISGSKLLLEIDADVRLVDFSSSGPIDLTLAKLGTAFNPALREGDARTIERDAKKRTTKRTATIGGDEDEDDADTTAHLLLPHPAAAPNMVLYAVPERGVMPLFDNKIIEFSFGLSNLKTGLEQLCEAARVLDEK